MLKKLFKPKLLFLLVLAAAAFFAYTKPENIPIPLVQQKVQQIKSSQSGDSTINIDTSAVLGQVQGIWTQFASSTTVPTQISGLPEEVVVEDVVASLTEEIKDIPGEQAKKIKTQFCQDVIQAATLSGSPAE